MLILSERDKHVDYIYIYIYIHTLICINIIISYMRRGALRGGRSAVPRGLHPARRLDRTSYVICYMHKYAC